MRRFALAAAAVLACAGPASAQSDTTNVVRHQNATPGLILQAVTVSPEATTIYLSGQLANPLPASAGKPAAELTLADYGDTRTQTVSVLGKIEAILEARGFAMSDVIKLTVFVAGDPALDGRMDFAGMNEGFRQFFGTVENPNTVARSTVQVAALVSPSYLVEIEAIAAK